MRIVLCLLLLCAYISSSRLCWAQASDCYPNCTVDLMAIARERVPVVTTVEAMGTKCDEELRRVLQGYRDEDARQYTLLRNQYCSALSGWQQISECEHGGPPPCCTAPAARMPWRQVGQANAKAVLFAEWHRIQSNRKILAERALNSCLHDLQGEGVNDFNENYARALSCLKKLQGDGDNNGNTQVVDGHVVQADKSTVDGYVGQLNSLHQRMQALASGTPDPNNVRNVANSMLDLQLEICSRKTVREMKPSTYPQLDEKTLNRKMTGASGRRASTDQPQVETEALTTGSPANSRDSDQSAAAVRQRQLAAIDEQSRLGAQQNALVMDGLTGALNAVVTYQITTQIRTDEAAKNRHFAALREQIKTQNGMLLHCSRCGGRGANPCATCQSHGFKACTHCNSSGKVQCFICGGTGSIAGLTCAACGGNGSKKCIDCGGKGQSVCLACNGLGKKQCRVCDGTGKQFSATSAAH